MVSRSTSVLFPAPGGPVTPTRYARPVRLKIARMRSAAAGPSSSIREMARAIARGSPASTRSARGEDIYCSNCRAMTSRWISLVPSPIVVSFTSRKNFSAG